jgi:hypothetical protein
VLVPSLLAYKASIFAVLQFCSMLVIGPVSLSLDDRGQLSRSIWIQSM